MSIYKKLQKRPKIFLSLVGVSAAQFAPLLERVRCLHQEQEQDRKRLTVQARQPRQRAIGGGRGYSDSLEDRLILTLMYLRLYVTMDLLSLLSRGADKSVISRCVKQMRPLLQELLPTASVMIQRVGSAVEKEHKRRSGRINNPEDFVKAYPELTFLIDGVEQPKRKPQDRQKHKSDYSGRKKRHTLKRIVISSSKGIILQQSSSQGGSNHDFSVFKEHLVTSPLLTETLYSNSTIYADSGFQGMDSLCGTMQVRLIERARRNRPLTAQQKQRNSQRSRSRVIVEHVFARLKKYRIAADVYRNHDKHYDQYMDIVGGLVNLRTLQRLGIAVWN